MEKAGATILSLITVVFLLGSGVTAEASAVKKREIEAEVVAVVAERDGKRSVKVKELSAKFPEGHSMGKAKPKPFELYNLKDDISESTNLAAKHPEKLDALVKTLQEHRSPSAVEGWNFTVQKKRKKK